jgi:murein DD-endopeptidase MepM/ murein hydrolase activator NlpD
VASLCVLALVIGTLETPTAEAATELGSQISSSRRGQSYFESAMLSADASVAAIKTQMKATGRLLREAKQAVTRSKRAHRLATGVVQQRAARLAELEAMHAATPPEQIPPGFADRVRSVRGELRRAQTRRQAIGQRFRTVIRFRSARQHRLNALKRSLRGAVARRESAEGGLGSYIVQLTRLAAQRAEIQSSVQLSVSGPGFTWPSVGRLAQTYGCTGFYLNPRRGSCRHFHDGLDIVSGYGSRVHSAADGVVAYAGWNPWDQSGRAWIMVVSHPNGYVTRYGHLIPGSLARVGQFVRQGEAIGKMGNTGNSLGTHLHFELLRGNTPLSPFAYLPSGMVTMKVAKHGGKKADRKHKRGGKGSRRKVGDDRRSDGARGGAARGASRGEAAVPSGGQSEVVPAWMPYIEGSMARTEAAGSDHAEDSAGATVRGRARRTAPDTSSSMSHDEGVSLTRRGTSPTPA